MSEGPCRPFYFPESKEREAHRMCASGQLRAAIEGNDLLTPEATIGHDQILSRAARAERALRSGADINKHILISYVVFKAFCDGVLSDYVDSDGNYVRETFGGKTYGANIFENIDQDRTIF